MQIAFFAALGAALLVYVLLCASTFGKKKKLFRKSWWVFVLIVVVAVLMVSQAVASSAKLTQTEIQAFYEEIFARKLQEDSKLAAQMDANELSWQVDISDVSIEKEPGFYLWERDLLSNGWLEGTVVISLDVPQIYEALESKVDIGRGFESEYDYTWEEIKELYFDYVNPLEEGYNRSEERHITSYADVKVIFVDSEANQYWIEKQGYKVKFNLYKNGECVYRDESSNSSSNSSSSGSKCPNCNGTGYVKYYYGSSDLEAALSGHDSYTVGECSMCDGTGKN